MNRRIHTRAKAAIAAAIVAAWAALCARAEATIYLDCFEVIPYRTFRHVACTIDGLADIHYAVDKFETNNWEAVCHGGGTESRIVKAQPVEHILTDNVFTNRSPSVTGTAYPFVFEFYNWYKIGTSGKTWYGYVSLWLDENAELVILENAITDAQLKTLIDCIVSHWDDFGRFKGTDFWLIITAADENKKMIRSTFEAIRGFMLDCMEGSVERGVIYGTGAYEIGAVKSMPVMKEAYKAGLKA